MKFAMRLYSGRIDVCMANRLDKRPLIKQMLSHGRDRTELDSNGGFLKAFYIGAIRVSSQKVIPVVSSLVLSC